ncbi:MAG: TolC family protein [Acidobacteria bacterium]|nr:MAG: TolC family protein [Acidobacteriota bacterium]REJ99317.1 MAG: TolC family protein [Acidobacteriota bacterium]REK15661.1 MAG: TolC family protein [Acidobacteriota bacterium]REK43644.1 MAG: TolC family protein [Acidobacteriota bacterium]
MQKQSSSIIRFLSALLTVFAGFAISVSAQTANPTPDEVKPENLAPVPEVAPGFEANDAKLPDLGRVGVDLMSQKPLALQEAIVRALENNKDIEVSRKDVRIAEFDLTASKGFFTPTLSGTAYYERSKTPNVSVFSNQLVTTNDTYVADAEYRGYVPQFGTVFTASFRNRKLVSDNPLTILRPQFDSSFQFRLVQPLFRGRKSDDARRNIEIAKKNLTITDKEFRQKAIEITVEVQKAYWNLTYALRNLQVQRDGVRDAKQQLAHSRRLVEEGVLAPIDAVAVETQVANLELNVYSALEQVNGAENLLKNLIAVDRNDPLWSESLVPTDNVDLREPLTTLPDALQLALQNRIEIDILEVAKEINEYDRKFYREQLEPEIDFTASYTSSGVAGTANPDAISIFSNTASTERLNQVINRVNSLDPTAPPIDQLPIPPARSVPESFIGGYNGAIGDVLKSRYPTFRVGVTWIWSPDDSAQRALLGKSLVQQERLRVQEEQLEQAIQMDVRNAMQSMKTARARLRAAAISRDNSEREYESEKRKLDAGLSDIYKVLERQTALMNAKSAELRAQTELNKAITDFQRATGSSLEANDVETRLKK